MFEAPILQTRPINNNSCHSLDFEDDILRYHCEHSDACRNGDCGVQCGSKGKDEIHLFLCSLFPGLDDSNGSHEINFEVIELHLF